MKTNEKQTTLEYLTENFPTMDLAKALLSSFIQKHPHTLEQGEGLPAYNMNIWVHDVDGEITIAIESHKEGRFTRLETEWSEFNELSKRSNVEV